MTVSTHAYAAVLIGSPDIALKVVGGSLTLDAGQAPHVSGDIEIAVPSLATLTALDPRLTKRIRVTCTATFPGASQSRTFDLVLRDRRVNYAPASVSLTLASDESLLSDYAPLTDDLTPLTHQASLRAIVNYVLDKAIPGKSLAATPAHDAVMTVFSSAENLFTDPRVIALSTYPATNCSALIDTIYPGAQDGVGHQGLYLHTPTGTDSRVSPGGDSGALRLGMEPGKTYVFSMNGSVRTALSGSFDTNVRRLTAWYRDAGGTYYSVQSAQISATVNADTRVSVEFTIPEGATEAFIRCYLGATVGAVTWALPRLTEKGLAGADDVTYFWGGKPDTAEYLYEWSGTADTSTSRRTPLIDRAPELLIWDAGRTAMEFLAPIVQYAGLRLVCDEARVWTLRDANYTAPGSLTLRHALNIVEASDSIARDSGYWFDAAVTVYTWTDGEGQQQTASDAYALTTPYTRLMTFYKERTPYPGPGFSQYVVERAQGRGREVSVTAVADWTSRAEQPITVILENAATQTGRTQSVSYDLSGDEFTVTTRTTETGSGSIDLLAGTINGLSGTINGL